jgi:hypothetical protein
MSVEITRFVRYDGSKGNAVAFADVIVREGESAYVYRDVKLYRDGAGFKISPRQIPTQHGWAFAYLIPRAFQDRIRRALIERYEAELAGQLALIT